MIDSETVKEMRMAFNVMKHALMNATGLTEEDLMRDEQDLEICKKILTAKSPTIWQGGQYKVTLNENEEQTKHHKKHVHLDVSRGNESGAITIENGEVLNGNLRPSSVKWCKDTVLTDENKQRIYKMIETKDYYRLDRPSERQKHKL